jgi:hypothetical protein
MIDLYRSRGEAEAALQRLLEDEPGWEGEFGVVRLDFWWAEANIEYAE